MELKRQKILLGGISRIPSDRMTKDGECAESLNVVSDNGEIIASKFPQEVTAEGLPDSWTTDCFLVFIHTTTNYTNYILRQGRDLGVWVREYDEEDGTLVAQGLKSFLTLADDEELKDVTAIGNTLVIATSESMYYVLYKDGEYRLLGSQLPKPAMAFGGTELLKNFASDLDTSDYGITEGKYTSDDSYDVEQDDSDDTQYIFASVEICSSKEAEEEAPEKEEITTKIWEAYDTAVAKVAKYNDEEQEGRIFYQPYFFRYALRLYDGTYAMQSVPILVGGGRKRPAIVGTYTQTWKSEDDGEDTFRAGALVMIYKVRAKLMEQISTDWSDIITSIDIFCSEPINMIDPGSANITAKSSDYYLMVPNVREVTNSGNNNNREFSQKQIQLTPYGSSESQEEDKLLGYNVFYLVGSFLIDNSGFAFDEDYDPAQTFTANQEDLTADDGITLKKPDADVLVTHTSTASDSWDDYECDHYLIGQQLETLNNRLAMWDVTKVLGTGLPVQNSETIVSATRFNDTGDKVVYMNGETAYVYRFLYEIETGGERKYVCGRDWDGNLPICPTWFGFGASSTNVYLSREFGWIAYPDANCRRVIFSRRKISKWYNGNSEPTYDGEAEYYSLPMKEHPWLNCAYAWCGWGVELTGAEASEDDIQKLDSAYEDRVITNDNYVYQSGVDDPFTFPAGGRYSFDYAVIGIGVANLPISQGQYSQFPLYVFTKGGIYAMAMNTDGTFATSSPFARDVALSRQSITDIDRGVCFATVGGVKVIEGGQITDISPLMTGEHMTVPERMAELLKVVTSFYNRDGEDEDTKTLISAAEKGYYDTTPFLTFMAGATVAYDYVGQRLVFVNPDYEYQYVYRKNTATWHKVCLYNVYYRLNPTQWSSDENSFDLDSYVQIVSVVNSWPKCYVSARVSSGYAVLDLSTCLDPTLTDTANGGNTLGLIYTRTIDFNNPDVFKSIRDLRIRGNFDRDNVRYVMLVSNDGRNWAIRGSLRGPSFKFMRLVILTKLAEGERISYVEFDYEERFTNRLR